MLQVCVPDLQLIAMPLAVVAVFVSRHCGDEARARPHDASIDRLANA